MSSGSYLSGWASASSDPDIDIQSLAADFCGWSCCAFLHYINAFDDRTGHIYKDTEDFCNLFVDLNKSCDYKYNAYGFLMELFREEM